MKASAAADAPAPAPVIVKEKAYEQNARGALRKLIDSGKATETEKAQLEHLSVALHDVRATLDLYLRTAETEEVVGYLTKLEKAI